MKKVSFCLFFLAETALYLYILLCDFGSLDPAFPFKYLKLFAVFLCLFYCLYLKSRPGFKKDEALSLVALSLLFSLLADYFLLFTKLFSLGICMFILVQVCYCKILGENAWHTISSGITCAAIFYLLGLILQVRTDLTLLLAVLYLTCLIGNLTASWTKSTGLFAAGITFLLLCDIHVGLSNLPVYVSLNPHSFLYHWHHAAPALIWLFYVPGQVCITISNIYHAGACLKIHS